MKSALIVLLFAASALAQKTSGAATSACGPKDASFDVKLDKTQHTLDEPVTEGGQDIRLHSSLGVAVAEDSESAEDVLARADRSTRVGRR